MMEFMHLIPNGVSHLVRQSGEDVWVERIGGQRWVGNAGGLRVWMGVMGHQRETNHAPVWDGSGKEHLRNAVW